MSASLVFLFAAPCFRVFGNEILHGSLTLIGERLRFDRPGHQPEWIPAHTIMGLESSPQGLTILTSFGLLRFFAKDFRLQAVARTLKTLRNPSQPQPRPMVETLLFCAGYINIPQRQNKKSFGGIHLTDQHLRFHCSEKINHLEISLDEITKLERLGPFGKIKITTPSISFLLYGRAAAKTFGYVKAMSLDGERQSIFRSWHCWYSKKGLLLTWSFVITTDRKLCIVPIHSLWPFDPIEVEYESIWQVEYNSKKLKIYLSSGDFLQLSLAKSSLQTHRLFCEHLCRSQRHHPDNNPDKANAILWLSTRTIQRGVLELKDDILRFSLMNPSKTSVDIPTEQLCRNDDGDTPPETLPIRWNDRSLLFFPSEPRHFIPHLYNQVNPPYRIINWTSLTQKGKQSLLGDQLAHLFWANNPIAVHLYFDKKLYISAIQKTLPLDTPLTIEFSTPNGRYSFTSEIKKQVQKEVWLLSSPEKIKMISQRSIERTPVSGMIHGMEIEFGKNGWLPKQVLFSFALIDISEKGCGLEGPAPEAPSYFTPTEVSDEPETGSRFLLDFTTEHQICQVQAECIYIQPQSNGLYRYGMKFISPNAGMKAKMNRLIATYKKNKLGY